MRRTHQREVVSVAFLVNRVMVRVQRAVWLGYSGLYGWGTAGCMVRVQRAVWLRYSGLFGVGLFCIAPTRYFILYSYFVVFICLYTSQVFSTVTLIIP